MRTETRFLFKCRICEDIVDEYIYEDGPTLHDRCEALSRLENRKWNEQLPHAIVSILTSLAALVGILYLLLFADSNDLAFSVPCQLHVQFWSVFIVGLVKMDTDSRSKSEAAKRMLPDLALTREELVDKSSQVPYCKRCWKREHAWYTADHSYNSEDDGDSDVEDQSEQKREGRAIYKMREELFGDSQEDEVD